VHIVIQKMQYTNILTDATMVNCLVFSRFLSCRPTGTKIVKIYICT